MQKVKTDSWRATYELDERIALFMSQMSEKFNVRIKTDSNYERGTIKISVKDGDK